MVFSENLKFYSMQFSILQFPHTKPKTTTRFGFLYENTCFLDPKMPNLVLIQIKKVLSNPGIFNINLVVIKSSCMFPLLKNFHLFPLLNLRDIFPSHSFFVDCLSDLQLRPPISYFLSFYRYSYHI